MIDYWDRFWSKVDASGDCWLWTGGKQSSGYGRISIKDTYYLAHRIAYNLLVDTIPENMTLDHHCRVRLCVNPDHLRVVSRGKNVLLGYGLAALNARKSKCKYGHSLSDAYINGHQRKCRPCTIERSRKHRLKLR